MVGEKKKDFGDLLINPLHHLHVTLANFEVEPHIVKS
jgi:hypothetical protein